MPQPIGGGPEKVAELRQKMMDHLEAALALADEKRDGITGYLIESALDQLRADSWPGNLDLPPRDYRKK
ncbi:MAG: hypothetical protein AB7P20_01450 [Rhizobiaceae bacterium]